MNAYQRRKARLIAAVLLLAATQTDVPFSQLPILAANMSEDQWRTVSFQAGVSIADKPARIYTIGLLLSIYGV